AELGKLGPNEHGDKVGSSTSQAVPGCLDDHQRAIKIRPRDGKRERDVASRAPAKNVGGRTDPFDDRRQVGHVHPVVAHWAMGRAHKDAPVIVDDSVSAGSQDADRGAQGRGLLSGVVLLYQMSTGPLLAT